jgi:hypothetical protein
MFVGKCKIHAEQNISFLNETKWNEILSRPKGWVQKIFWTLRANFGKGCNKSTQWFRSFCIASARVIKMQQIFNKNFESVLVNLVKKIFWAFTEWNKILWNSIKVYKVSWKLAKFQNSKWCLNHPLSSNFVNFCFGCYKFQRFWSLSNFVNFCLAICKQWRKIEKLP